MKKLIVDNIDDIFEAEKIVKTDTDIIGYTDNVEVFAFRGISDFTLFSLQNEDETEATYDTETNSIEILTQSIAQLNIESAKKDIQIEALVQTVTGLNIEIAQLKGGSN